MMKLSHVQALAIPTKQFLVACQEAWPMAVGTPVLFKGRIIRIPFFSRCIKGVFIPLGKLRILFKPLYKVRIGNERFSKGYQVCQVVLDDLVSSFPVEVRVDHERPLVQGPVMFCDVGLGPRNFRDIVEWLGKMKVSQIVQQFPDTTTIYAC